jgi:hypothetical protein
MEDLTRPLAASSRMLSASISPHHKARSRGQGHLATKRCAKPATLLTVLAFVGALAACGSTGHPNSSATTQRPPSTTSSVPPSTSSSVTSPTSSPSAVPSYVLPAPPGYAVGPGSGLVITSQDFNKAIGTGSATSTHFLHGYDITYESNATSESIESTLLTFASSADASGFLPQALEKAGAASLAPTRTSLSSIPGSVVLRSSKAGSDGFYLIDVIAPNGPTIMELEYASNLAPTGIPDVLSTATAKQYALL